MNVYTEHADPRALDHPPPLEGPPQLSRRLAPYWLLIVLVGLACGGAAAYLATQRDPVYTAEARLAVGPVDVTSPGLPGLVTASQSLAGLYSRSIDALPVVRRTARGANLSPDLVRDRVSASPIPESPVFTVRATGPSERRAIETANVSAASLRAYTRELNRRRTDERSILRRYQAAGLELDAAVARRQAAIDVVDATGGAEAQRELSLATVAAEAANLRKQTLANAFRQANEQGEAAAALVTVIAPAQTADGDRGSTLQLWAVGGLAAGLALGALLALAIDRRRAWR